MLLFVLLLSALLLDRLLGEPRRGHPLAGYGRVVQAVEARAWVDAGRPAFWRGVAAALVLTVAPVAVLVWVLAGLPLWAAALVECVCLYLCLGWRSLDEHAGAVARPLRAGELGAAREAAGRMVSRDTGALDEAGVARAATESVLENGNDAVFGTIFWFCLGGAPAAVFYRLANTLDAQWGYRNTRYRDFGRFAARLDDVLNYIPARLCALAYSLCGHTRAALACWRAQARRCASPNAGPVMAAGAGALGVQLGGPAVYHGELRDNPALGCGAPADAGSIDAARRLVARGVVLWLVVAGAIFAALEYAL